MSLVKSVEWWGGLMERDTLGHLLARLLGLVEESSPWLAEVVRSGGGKWVEAAQRRLMLSGFVDRVLEQPRETWRESFESHGEHHGTLLAIVLGNVGLRRLPRRPVEAAELARVARSCGGGKSGVDPEISLLLDGVEAVALQLTGNDLGTSQRLIETVSQALREIRDSIHPELVADAWWLCAVHRRLSGQLVLAEAELEVALSHARFVVDSLRVAEFELEKGLVLELAGRPEEAWRADERALEALREYGCGDDNPLVGRAVRQQATHLVDVGSHDRAERLLDQWEEVFRARLASSAVRLRGSIAKGRQKLEADVFLETAGEMARIDEDWPELGLAAIERVALFDDLGQWDARTETVRALRQAMMACPHAPGEILTALASLEEEAEAEAPWGPPVVGCLRRRFREWQARECSEVGVTVM